MKKIKGIVMQVEQKTMVVVTEAGDFLRVPVPAQRPYPGERVDVNVNKGFARPYWFGAVAVILILVLSLGLMKPMLMPQAVAAVSMDLNSSVELNVDADNRVVSASANNPEGQEVLQRLDLAGEDIYRAANMVTMKATELGYIRQDKESTIIVTVAPLKEDTKVAVDRARLQQTIHDDLADRNFQGYLIVDQAGMEMRQEARKMGLTVNQYLLWKRSQAQDAEIDINDLKDQPLSALLTQDETSMEGMFPGSWCRVGGMSSGRMGPRSMGPMGPMRGSAVPETESETDGQQEQLAPNGSEHADFHRRSFMMGPMMGPGGFMGRN